MTRTAPWTAALFPTLLLAALVAGCDADEGAVTLPDADTEQADAEITQPDAEDDLTEPDPDTVDPAAPLCDPAHGPVAPTPTAETSYDAWDVVPCLTQACLCSDAAEPFLDAMLRCEPVAGGFYWHFGSVGLRVLGRHADGHCRLEVAREVEGSATLWQCDLPLPASPWPGLMADYAEADAFLDGFPGTCSQQDNCCLLDGCPKPCDVQANWPLCFDLSGGGTECPAE